MIRDVAEISAFGANDLATEMLYADLDSALLWQEIDGTDLPGIIEPQQQAVVVIESIHAVDRTPPPDQSQSLPPKSTKSQIIEDLRTEFVQKAM